jgi:hypothetical protein
MAAVPAGAMEQRRSRARDPVDVREYTGEELQRDLRQFERIVESRHPRLYTDREAWDVAFDVLFESVEGGLTDLEFYRLLAPLVAALNCGHTSISLPAYLDSGPNGAAIFPPIRALVRDGRILVIETVSGPAIPGGAELLAVNSISSDEIIRRLEQSIPADGHNLTRKHALIRDWFAGAFAMHIQSAARYRVEYTVPGEKTVQRAVLPAVTMETMHGRVAGGRDGPALLQRFESGYAVLTVGTFNYYEADGLAVYAEFIDGFFDEVRRRGVETLVLDLRRNGGGSPHAAAHLYRYLLSEPHPYFSRTGSAGYADLLRDQQPAERAFHGALYVLIDGLTFSTSGHLSALLDYLDRATFVGEESGGSYVCTDNSRDTILANTGIRFRYSTAEFEVAVTGLEPGRGTMPDLPFQPSVQDYISGRDSVMEYVISLVEKRGG